MLTEAEYQRMRNEQFKQCSGWTDDEVVLNLRKLPILPDEDIVQDNKSIPNPEWDTLEAIKNITLYLVFAEVIGDRKIRGGVPLLLERASYGDFGETMRTLRHYLERAYAPDWGELADVCIKMAKSPHRGARLWAIAELGILREPKSLDALYNALYDTAELVRHQAVHSLGMLAQTSGKILAIVETKLKIFKPTSQTMRKEIDEALNHMQEYK